MPYTNHVTSWSNSAIVLLGLNIPYKSRRVPAFCFKGTNEHGFVKESDLPVPEGSPPGPWPKGPQPTINKIFSPGIFCT